MADPALLCITGPTASGKTDLAMALAERLDGELVSVDSALVYRGLDIGSAKPDFPHHLVDICDPSEAYSAARFAADARQLIEEIRGRGRRPILVGGTMLYFRALLQGLAPMPSADPAIRADIEREAQSHGWPSVHQQLAKADPESAAKIHPHHSQRLVRALEVYRQTGMPISALHSAGGEHALEGPVFAVALAPRDRAVLHARIAARFTQMLDAGFLDEVKRLRARGDLNRQLPAVRAVGYRQLWAHLDGECTLDEAIERAVVATRQLAKRQFTWLRKWPDLRWIYTDREGKAIAHSLAGEEAVTLAATNPADLLLNYLANSPI